jgi:hypothetical protein
MIPTFGSYIPAAATATVNNVSEEMTQLPASKKIRYAYDDDGKSLKNLITQETSINLQNVSEQVCSCIFFILGDQNQFLWSFNVQPRVTQTAVREKVQLVCHVNISHLIKIYNISYCGPNVIIQYVLCNW